MPKHATSTSWAKGVSGNPGGRPRALHRVEEMARAHTSEVLDTLLEIMRDRQAPHTARTTVALALWDRGWGKARSEVMITEPEPDYAAMSDAELDQRTKAELLRWINA